MEKGREKYELVVGQRRYLAFEELGKKKIPTIVIGELDPETKKIVSFSENIHRRKLPYNDTIAVCAYLFQQYSGSKKKKIEEVAKDLGINPSLVARYLSYQLVPREVRKWVEEEELSANLAYRITSAFWPNTNKIISIAKLAITMTKGEVGKILDVGRRMPDAAPEDLLEEAKKAPKMIKIEIVIPNEWLSYLEDLKTERQAEDIPGLIKMIVEEAIKEGAL
jgi:ParB/RepB/Spo0J family partition protein